MLDAIVTGLVLALIGAPVVLHCVLWPLPRTWADTVYWSILFLCLAVVAGCYPFMAPDHHPWGWDSAFVVLGAVWVAFGAFLAGLVRQYGKVEVPNADGRLKLMAAELEENEDTRVQRKPMS